MKQTGQTGLGLTVFWCESRSDGSISSSADKSPCLHELILCNIAGLSTHRSMLHYATVSPCLLPLEKRNIRDKTKKYSKNDNGRAITLEDMEVCPKALHFDARSEAMALSYHPHKTWCKTSTQTLCNPGRHTNTC